MVANGRKGLNESIQDIHEAVAKLQKEDDGRLVNKPIKFFFIQWYGKGMLIGLAYLIINTIFHAFNITALSFQTILKLFGGSG